MQTSWIWLGVVAFMVASACGDKANGVAELEVVSENGESIMVTEEHRELAGQAAALLAENLGIPEADVRVVTVQQLDWPDGSIGCPEPGHMYTMATVPGHKITLAVADRPYFVHEGNGRMFVCPR